MTIPGVNWYLGIRLVWAVVISVGSNVNSCRLKQDYQQKDMIAPYCWSCSNLLLKKKITQKAIKEVDSHRSQNH
jgi:hypothetical protein